MFSNLTGIEIVIVLVTLLISVGIHEAMHAYAGHQLGDTTAADEGRLTLNPLKHIDLITTILLPAIMIMLHLPPILAAKPVPFDPTRVRYGEYGAAILAMAGPFSNLALAALAAIAVNFGIFGTGAQDGLLIFMTINVALFVFNMLPIPPLDGSRLVYAFAPEPVQRVMYQIESLGFFGLLIILFLLLPFLSPILTNINQGIINWLI